ncbi:MAG: DUF4214 domain-containing protein [Acidimicrobiales bacterium]|nr:DUF4214 domain-containing protein [Acidimicrobiales bacterium]
MDTPTPLARSRAPRRPGLALLSLLLVAAVVGLPSVPPASATDAGQVTGLVSATSDNVNASGIPGKAVTAGDGRFVAFTDSSGDLVPGLPNNADRVFVRDLLTDRVELVSVAASGQPATLARVGAITPNGRFVAFASLEQLVPADTNQVSDVYVRDRLTGSTDLVSRSTTGAVGDKASGSYSNGTSMDISDDGRYVAFESDATTLIASDGNAFGDIYYRDRTAGQTWRASQAGAVVPNGSSFAPTLSADGRTIAFATTATNMIANDTNGKTDVVVRRIDQSLSFTRVSWGLTVNPSGNSYAPSISADGNRVAYTSDAPDLVASDTNGTSDVFVRTINTATTVRASVAPGGGQISVGGSTAGISADGSRVGFFTTASLDGDDADGLADLYVREGATTYRASVASGPSDSSHPVTDGVVSDDTTVFRTAAAMAATDTDTASDIYVRRTPFVGPHLSFEAFAATTRGRIVGDDSPEGAAAAALAIRSGASPEHQVMALIDQPSFSSRRAPVTRLYWAYFKRRPDLGGLTYWVKRYESGVSLQRISLQFATSSEFRNTYGNTTSTQFVTLVYQNVLEREPEPGGLSYWSKRIDRGTSRGQVMTSFSESSEGQRVMAPYVDTVLVGLGMLGGIPSQPLFDGAVASVKSGWPREVIVDYVLGAPEYSATISGP